MMGSIFHAFSWLITRHRWVLDSGESDTSAGKKKSFDILMVGGHAERPCHRVLQKRQALDVAVSGSQTVERLLDSYLRKW